MKYIMILPVSQLQTYRVAQKVSHYQMIKKSY